VDKLGNRSVTYGIGVFKEGEEQAAAHGYFVHVFVDRQSRKAVPMPERLREALERLRVG
jgi:acyl-CoA thioester hydrolase